MRKATVILLLASVMLTGAKCQTVRHSDLTTICLALEKSNALSVLTEREKQLIRDQFSVATRNRLKTPQAIMAAIGC